MYEKAEIKAPEDKSGKHLIIGVTSDRGLCGAIHSGVAKTIKNEIANLTGTGKEVMVVNVGDKLRGLLHRSEETKAAQVRADTAGFNVAMNVVVAEFQSFIFVVPSPSQNSRKTHHSELQGSRPQAAQFRRCLGGGHRTAELWL